MSQHRSTSQLLSKALSLGALFAALSTSAMAQVAITGVDYVTSATGPSVSSGGLTFEGNKTLLSTVSTATTSYNMGAVSPSTQVILRRPSSAGNYATTIAFQASGASSTFSGKYDTTAKLLEAANPYAALIDPFANGGGSNVERIDVNFGGPVSVQGDQALVFFDLNLNAGSSFRIALVTEWTGGAPSAYREQTVLVTADKFGNALVLPDTLSATSSAYQGAMYSSGIVDDLTGNPIASENVPGLSVSGVLVRFSDFGLSSTTQIYGYSVMSSDVTSITGSGLVALNPTVYVNTAQGGMDFAGFNTAIASPVPEPSTYGALLTAGSLGFFAWRRRRQSRAAVQA